MNGTPWEALGQTGTRSEGSGAGGGVRPGGFETMPRRSQGRRGSGRSRGARAAGGTVRLGLQGLHPKSQNPRGRENKLLSVRRCRFHSTAILTVL